jgi:osmotically-inducible protein OsmY
MNIRLLLGLVATLALTAGCGKSDADITGSMRTQLLADDTMKAHTIDVITHAVSRHGH